MRAPTRDYSSLKSAVANKYSAQAGGLTAQGIKLNSDNVEIAKKAVDISQKSIALSKKSLDVTGEYNRKQATVNAINAGVNIVNAGVDLASKIYSIVQTNQAGKAQSALLAINQENSRKTKESVLNGTSYIQYNEDGSYSIVIDPELVQWQQDQIKAFRDDKKMDDTVRNNAIASLEGMFSETSESLMSTIAKNAASEIQNSFNANLLAAQGQDVNLWSYEDLISGKYDDDSLYSAGYSLINSRKDLSDREKESLRTQYRESVNLERATNMVSEAARKGGKPKAYEVAEWFRSAYNYDDSTITKLINQANTSEAQYINAASSQVAETMTAGLKNGLLPEEIYRTIDAQLEGETEEHKAQIRKAATDAHIAWATADITERTKGYDTADIGSLAVMLDDIVQNKQLYEGGAEAVYNTAVSNIYKQMETFGDELAQAAIENIDTVKSMLATLDKQAESLLSSLLSGDENLTGYDVINAIVSQSESIQRNPEYKALAVENPELYNALLDSNVRVNNFVKKVIGSVGVDEDLQSALMTAYMQGSNGVWKRMGIKENQNLSVAQITALDNAEKFFAGSLTDLALEARGGKLSPEETLKRVDDLLAVQTSDIYDALTAGSITVKGLGKGTTEYSAAIEAFKLFDEHPGSMYYDDSSGKIVWMDKAMETTFNAAADIVKQSLMDQGAGIVSVRTGERRPDGSVSSVPEAQFLTSSGSYYTVDSESGAIYLTGTNGETTQVGADGELFNDNARLISEHLINIDPEVAADPDFAQELAYLLNKENYSRWRRERQSQKNDATEKEAESAEVARKSVGDMPEMFVPYSVTSAEDPEKNPEFSILNPAASNIEEHVTKQTAKLMKEVQQMSVKEMLNSPAFGPRSMLNMTGDVAKLAYTKLWNFINGLDGNPEGLSDEELQEQTREKNQEFANRNSGQLTSTQEAYASEIEAEGYDYNEARQLAPLVDKYRVEEKLSWEEALKKALKELGIKER